MIFSAVCLNVMLIYVIVYFNLIHVLIVSRDSQDGWVGFCYFVGLYICVRHIVNGCPEWVLNLFNYASSPGLYNALL